MNLVGKYKNILHFISSMIEVIRNGYPARKLIVIGVTGTDGKTTVCHLIYEMLKKSGKKVALVSSVAAYIGEKRIDTGFHVTTPDAKFLQPLIKKIKKSGIKFLVLETTSHGLDQHRVLGCNFWAGLLTNITHEHLDYHKILENYKKAKGKLFKKVKIAVLNKDDESYSYFRSLPKSSAKIITYSVNQRASLWTKGIKLKNNKMQFSIMEGKRIYVIKTKLIGEYNVSNILAATAVVRECKVNWDDILDVLVKFKGVSGRMETIDMGQQFSVIVDFAHTPSALEKVLTTLSKLKKGRLIVIFGCAGERDILKRPMMGEISTRLADISVFTAEDPRHEDVDKIIDTMVEGVNHKFAIEVNVTDKLDFVEGKHIFIRIPDRSKAINFAIRKLARKGDTVVICGKGHEKTMAFGDKEIPWSDHRTIKVALVGRF